MAPAAAAPGRPAPRLTALAERIVRTVEQHARLTPPRSVVVELGGGHGRVAVTVRHTEVQLAWDPGFAAAPDGRALQRDVTVALAARGYTLAGDRSPKRDQRRSPTRGRAPITTRRNHR